MENTQIVQRLQASNDLDYDLPNSILLPELLLVLMFAYALEYVAIVSKLHHNATGNKVSNCREIDMTYQRELEDSSKKACL